MKAPLQVTISAHDFIALRDRLLASGSIRRGDHAGDVITFELDGLTYKTTKSASRRARSGGPEPVILTVVE